MNNKNAGSRLVRTSWTLVSVLLALSAFALVQGVARWSVRSATDTLTQQDRQQELREYLAASPEFEEFTVLFPEAADEYAAYAARAHSVEEARVAGGNFMKNFIAQHRADAINAPSDFIRATTRAELAVLQAVQLQNIELCGRNALGVSAPGDSLPPAAEDAGAERARANVRLIAAGLRRPVHHGPVTADDGMAYVQALEKFAGSEVVNLMLDGQLSNASSTVQCEAGIAHFKALNSLPPAQAARLWADGQRQMVQGLPKA